MEEQGDTVFSFPGGVDRGLEILGELIPGTGLITSDSIILVTLGWVQFALTLLGVIAFVAFVYAGGLYVTSFGNEESVARAKKILLWTALGILIVLSSFAITSTLIRATA